MARIHIGKVIEHLRGSALFRDEEQPTDGQLLECFVVRREATALEALVRRHGPMVWGVCRRILRDHHDAEDAFQAVFLVLVRKAGSIKPREMVSNWLYGVARQTACKARASGAKRKTREKQVSDMAEPAVNPTEHTDDVYRILDDELARLPDKYRSILVLCDLEGKKRKEVAKQLGLAEGTVASRQARGRTMLAKRLARKGVTASGVALGALLTKQAVSAGVPATVLSTTIKAAGLVAAGQATAGSSVSAKAIGLAERVVKTMFLAKLTKWSVALVLLFAFCGAGLFAYSAIGDTEVPPTETALVEQEPTGDNVLKGEVVDKNGRAIADAQVWLVLLDPTVSKTDFRLTRTDRDGRFTLEIPPERLAKPPGFEGQIGLVTHAPGFDIEGYSFYFSKWRPLKSRVRFQLNTASIATVRVRNPDGQGVGGAKVRVSAVMAPRYCLFYTEHEAAATGRYTPGGMRKTELGYVGGEMPVQLPSALAARLEGTTAADGSVKIAGLTDRRIAGLSVDTGGFGTQSIEHLTFAIRTEAMEMYHDFRLKPTAMLKGMVKAKDAADWHGVKLFAMAGNKSSGYSHHVGKAALVLDDKGAFVVPNLIGDKLWFEAEYQPGAKVRLRQPDPGTVKLTPGKTTQVELELLRTREVRGQVLEAGAKEPIAGMRIFFGLDKTGEGEPIFVKSDAQGRFAVDLPPGRVYFSPLVWSDQKFLPLTPAAPGEPSLTVTNIPAGDGPHDVAPIVLKRAPVASGRVVDAKGKRMADAEVYIVGLPMSPSPSGDGWYRTDEQGEFLVRSQSSTGDIYIRARGPGGFSGPAKKLAVTKAAGLLLELRPENGCMLIGRVMDGEKKPFANLTLKVIAKPIAFQVVGETGSEADLPETITTDAAGKFRTAAAFDPGLQYKLRVASAGYPRRETEWHSAAANTVTFPNLTVGRVRELAGRVVDRAGQPIAGAKVTRMTQLDESSALTDAEGRFKVALEKGTVGFLFAHKPGFRFHGHETSAAADKLEIPLTRLEEDAKDMMRSVPLPTPLKQRRKIVAKQIDGILAEIVTKGKASLMMSHPNDPTFLASQRPEKFMEALEKKAFPRPYDMMARMALAEVLAARGQVEEAQALAEAIPDTMGKVGAYYRMLAKVEDAKAARKLVDHMLTIARGSGQFRLIIMTQAARRLRQIGDRAEADKILREIEPDIRKQPSAGFSSLIRGYFAREFVHVDPKKALELIAKIPEKIEYTRHQTNLAMELATTNFDMAEDIALGLLKYEETQYPQSFAAARLASTLCWHAAGKDPVRARKLADRIANLAHRAHAYGSMAQRLAKTQPKKAEELLRRAYDLAFDPKGPTGANWQFTVLPLGAHLLGVAEEIDARLVPELFWRTLSDRLRAAQERDFLPTPG